MYEFEIIFQFDPLDLQTKKAQTVILMLDSPEDTVLQSACEALYKFSLKCEYSTCYYQ